LKVLATFLTGKALHESRAQSSVIFSLRVVDDVLTGEKASGEFLIEQARLVDTNVDGVVIKGSGHWLMEEAPQQVIPKLVAFINKSQ